MTILLALGFTLHLFARRRCADLPLGSHMCSKLCTNVNGPLSMLVVPAPEELSRTLSDSGWPGGLGLHIDLWGYLNQMASDTGFVRHWSSSQSDSGTKMELDLKQK